jgi:hypothetical protein
LTIEASAAPPLVLAGLPAPERARRCLLDVLAHAPVAPAPSPAESEQRSETLVATIGTQHWWRLLVGLRLPLLGCGLALLASAGVTRLPPLDGAAAVLLMAVLAGLTVLSLAGAAAAFVGWRARRYGLTNDELIELVHLPGRTPRAVALTTLAAVQDVAYRVPHPLAHILDFGEVTLTTTDRARPLTLAGVAHPRAIHRAIGDRLPPR